VPAVQVTGYDPTLLLVVAVVVQEAVPVTPEVASD